MRAAFAWDSMMLWPAMYGSAEELPKAQLPNGLEQRPGAYRPYI